MTSKPGGVIWFTGLSGAGKSTIADGVREQLTKDGLDVLTLDGDDVRRRFHRHLGFSEPEVKENNMLIAEICAEQRGLYDVILVPIISPYGESRRDAREKLGPGFFEIFCNADLDTVVGRDVKGLYAKAAGGEMDGMIGFSSGSVYEPPQSPDLELDTAHQSPEDAVGTLYAFIRSRLEIDGKDRP
ncbi:MAG: adenylyl-sulfate kinase [Rhodospirillales bacterium]|nr:adenylyl-sulfate kinase [Rhodospirillales bacterium]